MKKSLLILFTFYLTTLTAQTTLNPGDIMFIGLNSDSTGTPEADEFDVLFLEPVTSGTEIYFTDMGYISNTAPYFQQNINNGCSSTPTTARGAVSDGIIKWTATSAVTAGTQLVIRVNISSVSGPTCNIGTVTTIVETQTSGTTINLSSAGEAIHAFQGTINGSKQVTSATMLASIDYDALWTSTLGTCEYNSTISEDPGTGFEVEYPSHDDNGYYSGDMTLDKAVLQTAILDMTNWTRTSVNDEGYAFPIVGDFTLNTANFALNDDIKMYPNPATSMVYISHKIKKATVHNALGKIVLKTTKNQFNIETLNSGIYLIKIESLDKNQVFIKKLMKI